MEPLTDRQVTRISIVALLGVAILYFSLGGPSLVTLWQRSALQLNALAGDLEARHDLRSGRLVILVWGMGGSPETVVAARMKERFGIEYVRVAGCVLSYNQEARWAAYDRVMMAEIDKRFGIRNVETAYREIDYQVRIQLMKAREPLPPQKDSSAK